MYRQGVELAISRSQVRCPTTTLPSHPKYITTNERTNQPTSGVITVPPDTGNYSSTVCGIVVTCSSGVGMRCLIANRYVEDKCGRRVCMVAGSFRRWSTGKMSIVYTAALRGLQGGPKIGTIFVRLNWFFFQNYFTVRIMRKFVIILSLKIPPHLKCVAINLRSLWSLYTILWNVSVLIATIEWKTRRFLWQHILSYQQQKTTCFLCQLLSKVALNYHILQVLHQMVHVSAVLLDYFFTNVFNCCF